MPIRTRPERASSTANLFGVMLARHHLTALGDVRPWESLFNDSSHGAGIGGSALVGRDGKVIPELPATLASAAPFSIDVNTYLAIP
jgi:hypothetical protein